MITTVTPNVALDKYYLVPGFDLRGVHRVERMSALPSGKGLNVARVLHRLGVPTVSTGVVAGYTGQQICRMLDDSGQKYDFVQAEGESRLCLTVMDPAADVHTEILEHGVIYTPEVETELEAKVHCLAVASNYVAVAGNPPAGTSGAMLRRLLAAAKSAGARVVLDARGEWLRQGVLAVPHIIKPNWQEFQELTGPCTDISVAIERARRLVDTGIELVLVSMGADGAFAVTATAAWHAIPPQASVVSPVGCGDALLGGLLAARIREMSLPDGLVYATAVAASNACHFGAGEFDQEQVERFLGKVVIEELT